MLCSLGVVGDDLRGTILEDLDDIITVVPFVD
jgi:hypothetical protein